jgi:hypothetical protein
MNGVGSELVSGVGSLISGGKCWEIEAVSELKRGSRFMGSPAWAIACKSADPRHIDCEANGPFHFKFRSVEFWHTTRPNCYF